MRISRIGINNWFTCKASSTPLSESELALLPPQKNCKFFRWLTTTDTWCLNGPVIVIFKILIVLWWCDGDALARNSSTLYRRYPIFNIWNDYFLRPIQLWNNYCLLNSWRKYFSPLVAAAYVGGGVSAPLHSKSISRYQSVQKEGSAKGLMAFLLSLKRIVRPKQCGCK